MTRQTRPRWPSRTLTADWKGLVQRELDDRAWTQTELAQRLGVTKAAISVLLKPETNSSRLVTPICELLNVPGPEFRDGRDEEVVEDLRRLREEDPEEYDRLASKIRASLNRPRRH